MIIFHIATRAEWEPFQKNQLDYRALSLESEGFIHASLADQVPRTLNVHFKGEFDLFIMKIDTEKLTSKLVFEDLYGAGQEFPHVYGVVNRASILEVEHLKDTSFVGAVASS